MRLLVIDNAEPHDADFNAPLREALAELTTIDVVNYRQLPPIDTLAARYDGIVLSGTPVQYAFAVIDARAKHLAWIRTTQLPVLGICLGHQSLARMHGARLIVNHEAEDGLQPLHITGYDPLFNGVVPGDTIRAYHRASVTLPDGFTLLASTSACANQAMKHVEKDLYGVQFHAELSGAGRKLLSNFVDIVKANNLTQ